MRFLNLIIDIFAKTHEPVGSKSLTKSIQSSSATVRNDGSLGKGRAARKGSYISGRKPSVAGFQYFYQVFLD